MDGITVFRLWDKHQSGDAVLGLSCDESGIFLGGHYALVIPIADAAGRITYRPRALCEINGALSGAYGLPVDFSTRMARLKQAAEYMNRGDWVLARIATVQLCAPDLPDRKAVLRLRKANLLRFNPNHYPAGSGRGGQFAPAVGSPNETAGVIPARDSSSGAAQQRPLPRSETPYVAQHYTRFKTPVGDGQCVALVQAAAGVPNHTQWQEGAPLSDRPDIPEGTAIATFVNGKYPNAPHGNHAAIFVGYGTRSGRDGIWVYDQWSGKAPGKRFLPFDNASRGRSNDASAFSVIK